MKKIYTLIGIFTFGATLTFAQQQLENPGFETWDNLGSASEEPAEWSSLKTADALAAQAPKVLFQDAGRTGGFSIKLVTGSAFGIPANGMITNGRVHADFTPSNGYVYTETSDSKWNTPFSSFPDSLVGYYKYTPVGSDPGKVEIILHTGTNGQMPENGTAGNRVGRARFDFSVAQSNWTRFSVPFHYYNHNTPQYILSVLTSGDSTMSTPGTTAWFDDIELIYNTITTNTIAPLVYNVTNTTGDAIIIPFTLSGDAPAGNKFIAQLSDETGSFAHPTNLDTISGTTSGSISTMIPRQTQPGTGYRVRVIATNDAFQTRYVVANTDDITINLQGTYITPDNNDMPSGIVGQGSIVFTVFENPTALGREWFFSDSLGAVFNTFSPSETGTTLNYNPATKGYTKIMCTSFYATDTLFSNAVLTYYGQLGLLEYGNTLTGVNVYQSSNSIVISSDKAIEFVVYDASGRKLNQGKTSGTTSFQPKESGLYLIQLSDGKSLETRKLIFNN